jgi:hypothetical protein
MSAEWSPRLRARVAGIFWAITIVTGFYGYAAGLESHVGHVAILVAGAAYLVVTLLLYELLKPVSRSLSLLAAFFSIVGVANSADSLFFFGFYCILLGYLIFISGFFPRAIGVLMVLAGCGLLTNYLANSLPPAFAHILSPAGLGLDGVGEMALTLWLLAVGVDVPKWEAKANQPASGTAIKDKPPAGASVG